jgi:hypothetical protein
LACRRAASSTRAWTAYVVDINGKTLAVVARHLPGTSEQVRAEVQAIIDSIRIEP